MEITSEYLRKHYRLVESRILEDLEFLEFLCAHINPNDLEDYRQQFRMRNDNTKVEEKE